MSNDVTEFQIGMVAEMDMETGTMTLRAPDKYEDGIITWCDNLKRLMLDKYRKGKAEHGDLSSGQVLDCKKESLNEFMDLIIYQIIDVVQKQVAK